MSVSSSLPRTAWTAVRGLLVLTAVVIVYTAVMTGVGAIAFPHQSQGSMSKDSSGQEVGSTLIGQSFTDDKGQPIPGYFQSRPSKAGEEDTGYDAQASGGSNLGPTNPDLLKNIDDRRQEYASFNGVDPKEVPADALTTSTSGLDPHISPENARLQVQRVAKARKLGQDQVQQLVDQNTQDKVAGFMGEPVVNVLELNKALDAQKG